MKRPITMLINGEHYEGMSDPERGLIDHSNLIHLCSRCGEPVLDESRYLATGQDVRSFTLQIAAVSFVLGIVLSGAILICISAYTK